MSDHVLFRVVKLPVKKARQGVDVDYDMKQQGYEKSGAGYVKTPPKVPQSNDGLT